MQVAGQEAEPFSRLHGRTGQNNAVDRLCAECRDRRRNCKIGLARTGRTNTDGDGIFPDRLHIPLLSEGLCLNGLSFCRDADNILCHFADFVVIARGDKVDQIAYLLLIDRLSLCRQCQ